jgi:hypothetical protein
LVKEIFPMDDWKLPWEGGCRCDRVRFKVSAPPLVSMACHCTGCQKMTGSAYSLSLMILDKGFEVTKGEPVIGGLHGDIRHYFCSNCMSWVFTRPNADMPFVNLRSTMLDDASWVVPFIESYVSEKLPWAATAAVHSFDKFPLPEDYPALIKAYAAQGARPV